MNDCLNAMNNCLARILSTLAICSCLGGAALAQTTGFTYQGRLNDGTGPANGLYDLQFALYDDLNAGTQQGSTVRSSAVAVSNGLFTVVLDFGNQFPGANRWLEIAVEPNGGSGFTTLTPRQPLTPTPYAIFAGTAGTLTVANNQPVNLTVNGTNVLQINSVYDSAIGSYTVNSLGGYSGNVISNGVVGGFIGGGGNAAYPNRVGANYASVLGGLNNTASGVMSTALGYYTTASAKYSTAMGFYSTASGVAFMALGDGATASGLDSTAMGGGATASGDFSTAMGFDATASGYVSTALGEEAQVVHDNTFLWSDGADGMSFSSIAPDQFMVHATGGLQLFEGGLAVSGASSPNYSGAHGVFIESHGTYGSVFAFDYVNSHTLPLCLNSPGGYVGIGTASPDAALTVYGAADKPGGGSWNTYSDARLEDVGTNFTPGLAALAKIQPVYNHYKTDNALKLPSKPEYIGVVAQQLQQAMPAAVQTNSAWYVTINNDPILWTTVNAVKELNQKLETENADMKARLERMEKRLNQTEK